jgi:hypothetical protein
MKTETFDEALRGYQRRQPFQPFIIHFGDGAFVLVEHPETVISADDGTVVHLARSGGLTIFDSSSVTRLQQVADQQEPAAA